MGSADVEGRRDPEEALEEGGREPAAAAADAAPPTLRFAAAAAARKAATAASYFALPSRSLEATAAACSGLFFVFVLLRVGRDETLSERKRKRRRERERAGFQEVEQTTTLPKHRARERHSIGEKTQNSERTYPAPLRTARGLACSPAPLQGSPALPPSACAPQARRRPASRRAWRRWPRRRRARWRAAARARLLHRPRALQLLLRRTVAVP